MDTNKHQLKIESRAPWGECVYLLVKMGTLYHIFNKNQGKSKKKSIRQGTFNYL